VAGRRQTVDCGLLHPGFSCQSAGGQFFCGLGAECAPAGLPPGSGPAAICDGSAVVVCNAGRIERVDCLALGFIGCEFNPRGGNWGCIRPPASGPIP
jgi:hypothetical protein